MYFIILFIILNLDFLRNNAIMNQLLQIKGSSALPKQQQEILSILAQQNILHPELLQIHYETFIKMKDKDSVSSYLKEFLHISAYLGYQGFDVQKLIQVFRRIHRTPQEVKDIQQVLNLLLILAQSGTSYKTYDEKSIKFIEDALDLIDEKFQGIQSLIVQQEDEISGEKKDVEIKYLKSVVSTDRIYHKFQLPPAYSRIDIPSAFDKYRENYDAISDDEKQSQFSRLKISEGLPQMNSDSQQASSSDDNEDAKQEATRDQAASTNTVEQDKELLEQVQDKENANLQKEEVIDKMIEMKNSEKSPQQPAEAESSESQEDQEDITDIYRRNFKKKPVLKYERKASEADFSEELAFHNYRKKKLKQIDKKQKHLLLFSNINQLNFTDINKSDVVKAWTILFHFRSKGRDSVLYDEFESVTMRNSASKGKGHEYFSKFYKKLLDYSYQEHFKLSVAQADEATGWPLDIIMSFPVQNDFESVKYRAPKKCILFFLQEELCFNSRTNKEEPLGLQKLMINHLKSFSNYATILMVSENDFYLKEKDPDWFDQAILNKLNLLREQEQEDTQVQSISDIFNEKNAAAEEDEIIV